MSKKEKFEPRSVIPTMRYVAAGSGLVDPPKLAGEVGLLVHGVWLNAYMMRRFGPPMSGWDDYKNLATWTLSTPNKEVFLRVTPYLGDRPDKDERVRALSFGYGISSRLAEQFDQPTKRCAEKSERFRKNAISWARKNLWLRKAEEPLPDRVPIEVKSEFPLTVGYLREPGDPENLAVPVKGRYREIVKRWDTWVILEIERFYSVVTGVERPEFVTLKEPRRSVERALKATLRDLKRPTYVRDISFNPEGYRCGETLRTAEYFEFAGYGWDLGEAGREERGG